MSSLSLGFNRVFHSARGALIFSLGMGCASTFQFKLEFLLGCLQVFTSAAAFYGVTNATSIERVFWGYRH
jgi:hypothetical protein